MRERGDGSVNLDNQCPVTVGSFLDFAYSGEMLITDGNVDMLFQLASFLQVEMQRFYGKFVPYNIPFPFVKVGQELV